MRKRSDFKIKKAMAMLMANVLCCTALAFSNILCMGNWWEPKMPEKLKK